MSYPKAVFFALFLVVSFSSFSFATPVPANGDYDTLKDPITAKTLMFSAGDPWTPLTNIQSASITVYATKDYTEGYSGATSESLNEYNITTTAFYKNMQMVIDKGLVSGDLAIRYESSTLGDITFSETVVTINFIQGSMDVYLPQVTLTKGVDMHLWVADDGSTYFANVTDGDGSAGNPNITAAESIAGEHVAAIPEPATLLLLGLGGYFLHRRK